MKDIYPGIFENLAEKQFLPANLALAHDLQIHFYV